MIVLASLLKFTETPEVQV